jgi:hypothetical protein
VLNDRETYAAEEALQRREGEKQDQDRLALHLDRKINVQKARLAHHRAVVAQESAHASRLREGVREVAEASARVRAETQGAVGEWREAVAELHRKDQAVQVTH